MRNYENRWVPTRSSHFCIVHSGRGRWEEDTLHSFTMTKERLRLGCLSNASMRETNIISDTGGADRMKRSRQWMDNRAFFWGCFFSSGVERGRGHRVASQTADGGFSLFIMGKCHRAPQTPTRECFRNAQAVTSARQMGCFTDHHFFFFVRCCECHHRLSDTDSPSSEHTVRQCICPSEF